jgi:hypothetical protein
MMNSMMSRVVPCMLWAGVAIASTTPANALASSAQTGNVANVSSNYVAGDFGTCNAPFAYIQTMRFVTSGCSAGNCKELGETSGVLVDYVHTVGRRDVEHLFSCDPTRSFYALGSCPC